MSYILLILRHSGPCVLSSSNTTSQYGGPRVAAETLCRGRFVHAYSWLWSLPPPGLPLPSAGPKPLGTQTRSGSQSHFHRQLASPTHQGGPSSLPPPGFAFEPRGGELAAAMAPAASFSWLSRSSKPPCHAVYLTMLSVMLTPNWLKPTVYWCRHWHRTMH